MFWIFFVTIETCQERLTLTQTQHRLTIVETCDANGNMSANNNTKQPMIAFFSSILFSNVHIISLFFSSEWTASA